VAVIEQKPQRTNKFSYHKHWEHISVNYVHCTICTITFVSYLINGKGIKPATTMFPTHYNSMLSQVRNTDIVTETCSLEATGTGQDSR